MWLLASMNAFFAGDDCSEKPKMDFRFKCGNVEDWHDMYGRYTCQSECEDECGIFFDEGFCGLCSVNIFICNVLEFLVSPVCFESQ